MPKKIDTAGLKHFKDKENAMVASEFSASKSYAIGEYVYYKGTLYKFKAAHAAGAWTNADVDAVKLADDVSVLKESLSNNAIPVITSASGAVASFTDGADDLPVKNLKINIKPLQIGTGEPSPDNVRPISGWESAKLTRLGKNWFNFTDYSDWSNGYIMTSGNPSGNTPTEPTYERTSPFIPVVGGQIYTLSYEVTTSGQTSNNYAFYDENKTFINGSYGSLYNKTTYTVTAPENAKYMRCSLRTFNNATKFQLELGSIKTDYEEYNALTIIIAFPSEEGVIYGGVLDITTGVLTVNKSVLTIDGTRTWRAGSWGVGRRFYTVEQVIDAKQDQYLLASALPTATSGDSWIRIDTATAQKQLDVRILSSYSYFNTLQDWVDYITATPITAVYELETPKIYQLTEQEIKTLLGINNIWSNVGDTDVKYTADTKLYIDNKIAELQATMLENIGG